MFPFDHASVSVVVVAAAAAENHVANDGPKGRPSLFGRLYYQSAVVVAEAEAEEVVVSYVVVVVVVVVVVAVVGYYQHPRYRCHFGGCAGGAVLRHRLAAIHLRRRHSYLGHWWC